MEGERKRENSQGAVISAEWGKNCYQVAKIKSVFNS